MRLFVLIGGLVVAVLMTALVAPLFINWSDYKGRFEQEASRLLGQPVRVAGEASARILPFPSVSFTDVEVGPPGSPLVTAARFSLDVELAPFLSGEVLIFDLRIDEPDITLTLDERGVPIWPLPDLGPISPAQITLENAAIRDGRLTVLDPEDERGWTVDDLTMRVSANSFFGPWRAEGSARIDQLNTDFTVSTGQWARDGFSLRVAANLPDQLVRLVSEGRIAPNEEAGALTYAGRLTVLPHQIDQVYRIEGDFSATARALEVSQYRAAFGDPNDPYVVEGAASIFGGGAPGFTLSATGTQVNVPVAGAGETPGGETALGERLKTINSMLAGLPWPSVPGTVNLDLPAVVAGGTTIRDVRVIARPAPDDGAQRQWRIDRMDAQLPGRTAVEADGLLTMPQPGEGVEAALFVGDLVVASRQPSGLARWLAGDVDEAIRRLPGAGVSAELTLSTERQIAENAEIIAGDVQLNGRLARRSGGGATPYLSVSLSGDDVDLQMMEMLASVFGVDQGGLVLAGHDVDLSLALTDADIDGVVVDRLETAVRARGPRTEIDRLVASGVFGAAITGTGSIDRLEGGDLSVAFDASVISADGAPFVRAMAARFPGIAVLDHAARVAPLDPLALTELQLTAVGSARTSNGRQLLEASASASGLTGGARLFVQTGLTDTRGTAAIDRLSIDGSLTHDDALRLLPFAAVPLAVPEGSMVGLSTPGEASVTFRRAVGEDDQVTLALTAGDDRLGFDGMLSGVDGPRAFDGVIDLDLADAEPWLLALGHVLPGTGLGTPLSGVSDARIEPQLARFAGIQAELAGSAVRGDLEFADDAVLGRSLRGDLALSALDADLIGGFLTGHVDPLMAATQFNGPLYDDVAVNLRLEAGRLHMGPVAFDDATAVIALDGGLLTVQAFQADHGNGARVAGSGRIQNAAGAVTAGLQIDIQDAPIKALIAGSPPVSGRADLALALTGDGSTPEALASAMTGTGVVALKEPSVDGLNAAAFDGIVHEADAIGFGIMPEQIIAATDTALFSGQTGFADVTAPVTVAGGVMRAGNLVLDALDGGMRLAGDMSVDLVSGHPSGALMLTLDAGDEAVTGMAPEVGLAIATDEGGRSALTTDYQPIVAFVTQRALEIEQARIERLQSRLLERQRLRRELRYVRFVQTEENTRRREERLRELARLRLEAIEAERLRQIEEEAARQAEEEAARLAEEEMARQAEEEAARRAAEEEALEGGAVLRAPLLPPDVDDGAVAAADVLADDVPADDALDPSAGAEPQVDFSEDAVRNLIEGLGQ